MRDNILKFYLTSREYTAWYIWEGNLEYLCREDTAHLDNDSLINAWDSANGKITVRWR